MVTSKKTSITKNESGLSFSAESYTPGDVFTPSSNVPYIPESEYRDRLEKVRGQLRSVEIAQQNLILAKQLQKTEGYAIDTHNEGLKNKIKLSEGDSIRLQIEQSQVHTQIEQAKLLEIGHDLTGYQSQANLREDTWNLKIEGLRTDIEKAKILLSHKKEELKLIQGN